MSVLDGKHLDVLVRMNLAKSELDRSRIIRSAVDESLGRSEEIHTTATDALNARRFDVFFETLKENTEEQNFAHNTCRLMEDTEDINLCISSVDQEHKPYLGEYTDILNRACR